MWLGFFSLLIGNCGRKGKLRKELKSKNEPAFDDLEDSPPIQRVYLRNGAKSLAGKSFTKEIRYSANCFNQPSQ